MRLLEIESGTLKDFTDETRVSYAILSHRWEDDEVLFQDLMQGTAPLRKGWQKVENFCRIAQKEGFRYVWIDTCCIDKSSSAELSEAINSMYRWYQNADTCFAYLNDCKYDAVRQPGSTEFQKSKWFTRGWTLQELIAPTEVVFLSAEWREFGTKRSLVREIFQITNIDQQLLVFPRRLNKYCAAQKLSWAATRETTRVEDRAYSLMGLFNVNMPLLYGEGDKAFYRLQIDILQSSNDQSIFAWERDFTKDSRIYSSILATSIGDFEGCHTIRYTPREIEIDHDSGVAEFPQQVVGPFIKLKALSIPGRLLIPSPPGSEQHQQQPPWLTSIYQQMSGHAVILNHSFWVVLLVDCSEEGRTVGIGLEQSGRSFLRCHGPSRFLLSERLDSISHVDFKERIFHARSTIKKFPIHQEPTLHIRHLPPQYGLQMMTPVLLPSGDCDSQIYWRNIDGHEGSLGRIPCLRLRPMGTEAEGVYFSLVFGTIHATGSLPPFYLQFWYSYGGADCASELVVLFQKGNEALNPNSDASQKPSSPDLLLGLQEFGLIRGFVVVVKARDSTDNRILLNISVEEEWTGETSDRSASPMQEEREPDAWLRDH